MNSDTGHPLKGIAPFLLMWFFGMALHEIGTESIWFLILAIALLVVTIGYVWKRVIPTYRKSFEETSKSESVDKILGTIVSIGCFLLSIGGICSYFYVLFENTK